MRRGLINNLKHLIDWMQTDGPRYFVALPANQSNLFMLAILEEK